MFFFNYKRIMCFRPVFKSRSIFTKLLIVNGIFLMFICSLLLLNNNYIKNKIQAEIYDTNEEYMYYVSDNIDNELSRLKNIVYSLSFDDDFKTLSFEKDSSDYVDYYTKINTLSNSLSYIRNSFYYATDVYIYFKNINRIITSGITSGTAMNEEVFYTVLNKKYPDFSPESFAFTNQYKGFCVYKDFVLYSYPVNENCYIEVQIDKSNLMQYLNSQKKNLDNVITIIDERGELFAANQSISRENLDKMKELVKNHGYSMELENVNYHFIYGSSKISGLTFIVLYPSTYLENKIHSINTYTVVLFIIFISVSMLILVMNIKMFNPIKMIISKFKGNILQPGFREKNELAILDNILTGIKTENDNLKTLNIEMQEIFLHHSMMKILMGEDESFDTEVLKELDKRLEQFLVLSIIVEGEDQEKTLEAMEVLNTRLKDTGNVIHIVRESRVRSYILTHINISSIYQEITEIGEEIISEGMYILAGMSRFFGGVQMLGTAYRQSLAAIDSSPFDISSNMILSVFEEIDKKDNSISLSLDEEYELTQYVLRGNENEIVRYMDRIFQKMVKSSNKEAKTLAVHLSDLLNTILYNKCMVAETLQAFSAVDLSCMYAPFLICKQLKDKYMNVAKLYAPQNDILLTKLMEYINSHYMQDLSLEIIADQFGITPVYVSMYFKKQTGVNFVPFLNKLRVEKAIEIMATEKKLSIAEISKRVGFINVNTFINYFKKQTGVSPNKYRIMS